MFDVEAQLAELRRRMARIDEKYEARKRVEVPELRPKPRNQAHERWVSKSAGRNTSAARAGLETNTVDADRPLCAGRPVRLGKSPARERAKS